MAVLITESCQHAIWLSDFLWMSYINIKVIAAVKLGELRLLSRDGKRDGLVLLIRFTLEEQQYRADWEPAGASGRRVLGVFWRYPAVLLGPSTPYPTLVSWKTLILKNWPIFPTSCGYVVDWPHVAQVRFWRPKRPHSEKRHVIWRYLFGNPPYHGTRNCELFKKLLFMGQKVCFGLGVR